MYTADDEQWSAEAVAIRGDRIVFVGSAKEANQWRCGAAGVIDLEGRPSFRVYRQSSASRGWGDGREHYHYSGLQLCGTVNAIEQWSEQVEAGDWVLGRGWIERECTDEQRFLTRHDVDAFTVDKPLYLPRADGVSALVNSKALALAGISNETPDPVGGQFHRDSEGQLTAMF